MQEDYKNFTVKALIEIYEEHQNSSEILHGVYQEIAPRRKTEDVKYLMYAIEQQLKNLGEALPIYKKQKKQTTKKQEVKKTTEILAKQLSLFEENTKTLERRVFKIPKFIQTSKDVFIIKGVISWSYASTFKLPPPIKIPHMLYAIKNALKRGQHSNCNIIEIFNEYESRINKQIEKAYEKYKEALLDNHSYDEVIVEREYWNFIYEAKKNYTKVYQICLEIDSLMK